MKKPIILLATLFLFPFFISSCDPEGDTEPRMLLDEVGFEGTLPDGSSFGNTDIRSANGTGISGVNAKYKGRHILSIRSFETGWAISVELPSVDFSVTPPIGEKVPVGEVSAYFSKYYPYELVLEKLEIERQKADSNADYSSLEVIRVQLSNQNKFFSYLFDEFDLAAKRSVRVIEVVEGIEKNLLGVDVRKIEVIFAFDFSVSASDPSVLVQKEVLKGIARVKYREDFYQGEFEK